jgi:hypothetical protein
MRRTPLKVGGAYGKSSFTNAAICPLAGIVSVRVTIWSLVYISQFKSGHSRRGRRIGQRDSCLHRSDRLSIETKRRRFGLGRNAGLIWYDGKGGLESNPQVLAMGSAPIHHTFRQVGRIHGRLPRSKDEDIVDINFDCSKIRRKLGLGTKVGVKNGLRLCSTVIENKKIC